LIGIEKDFWVNHVEKRNPPLFDGSEASVDLLKVLYPQSEPQTEIHLPEEAETLITLLDEIEPQIKELETKKKEAEIRLKDMLREYESGWVGERRVDWKTVYTNRVDTKRLKAEKPDVYKQFVTESTSRRFKVK